MSLWQRGDNSFLQGDCRFCLDGIDAIIFLVLVNLSIKNWNNTIWFMAYYHHFMKNHFLFYFVLFIVHHFLIHVLHLKLLVWSNKFLFNQTSTHLLKDLFILANSMLLLYVFYTYVQMVFSYKVIAIDFPLSPCFFNNFICRASTHVSLCNTYPLFLTAAWCLVLCKYWNFSELKSAVEHTDSKVRLQVKFWHHHYLPANY